MQEDIHLVQAGRASSHLTLRTTSVKTKNTTIETKDKTYSYNLLVISFTLVCEPFRMNLLASATASPHFRRSSTLSLPWFYASHLSLECPYEVLSGFENVCK
jgi:hypothetical protein